MTMIKPIRRSWLRCQIEAGRVQARVLISSSGNEFVDRLNAVGQSEWLPVRIALNQKDYKPTHINLCESEYRHYSTAYLTERGATILSLGWCGYELRIAEEAKAA